VAAAFKCTPSTSVIGWGDWGSKGGGHMKCHQPTLTVGLPKIFKKAGFTVGFVDEAYTSKTCSKYKQQTLGSFLQVKNPRFQYQQQRERGRQLLTPPMSRS
jgi:hypothetical protein